MAKFIFQAIDTLGNPMVNPKRLKNVQCVAGTDYDLFYADNQTKGKPIIVNIHGGGFVTGDKKYRRYWCETLAAQGWFVINANYRLCPQVTIIDQIRDVWQVLQQTTNLATQYQLNDHKIVVAGDSAGAFFAAYMVALTTNPDLRTRLGITENLPFPLAGAILFCGVYDFLALLEQHQSGLYKEIARDITGLKLQKISEIDDYPYKNELSLLQFVNPDWCPVAMCYAQKDLFLKGQGEMLYQALQKNGIPCALTYSTKLLRNHDYQFLFHTKSSRQTMRSVHEFLAKIKTK